jgi:hypothetical protein
LEGIDLSGAIIDWPRPPRHWPVAADIADPCDAAAYASLAEDRLLNCVLLGELVTLVAGAAVGTALASFDLTWRRSWVLGVAILITLFGIFMRTWGTRVWEPVYVTYRSRYDALSATPLPAPRRRGRFAKRR